MPDVAHRESSRHAFLEGGLGRGGGFVSELDYVLAVIVCSVEGEAKAFLGLLHT